jgi:hypothetical protein
MRILEKIVLHPKLENKSREEVRNWCKTALGEHEWWVNSNYTEHGCFNLTILGGHNETFVTAFMIKYPETIIEESKYTEIWEPALESLALFEGLE